MSDSQNRVRKKSIKVWVTDDEKTAIEDNAGDCSMSASSFLRGLGLGYIPPSKVDKKHVLELAKINGDLGRLGGLLKMWLTNEERQEEIIGGQVRSIIEQIGEAQNELLEVAKRL